MTRTGHGACRMTSSATLPNSARWIPWRPWLPITMTSAGHSFAVLTISEAGLPTWMNSSGELRLRQKLAEPGDQSPALTFGLRDQFAGRDARSLRQTGFDRVHKRDFGSQRRGKLNAELGGMDCERRGIDSNQYSSEAHKNLLLRTFGAASATGLGTYLCARPKQQPEQRRHNEYENDQYYPARPMELWRERSAIETDHPDQREKTG